MVDQSIVIRRFQINDSEDASKLINNSSLPHWKEQGLSDEIINELIKKHHAHYLTNKAMNNPFFIAKDIKNHKIVGIIGLRPEEDSKVPNRLTTFFIDPNYQGKKIGRMLYERIKEEAINLGCNKLVVSSTPYAEPIYKHFGFEKVRVEWKNYDNGTRSYSIWMTQNLK